MAYSKQTFTFNQVLTAAEMNTVEDNIEDSRLASGTRAVFNQTTAPSFWTKVTTAAVNDNALRITTGTVGSGGTVDFLSTFGASSETEGHSLTTAELAAHSHTVPLDIDRTASGGSDVPDSNVTSTVSTNSTGSGDAHTHGMPELSYQDVILAQKD